MGAFLHVFFSKHKILALAEHLISRDINTSHKLSAHIKVLGFQHQYHVNKRIMHMKIVNKVPQLNICSNYEVLKNLYSLLIGKSIDNMKDSNCIHTKISKVII